MKLVIIRITPMNIKLRENSDDNSFFGFKTKIGKKEEIKQIGRAHV